MFAFILRDPSCRVKYIQCVQENFLVLFVYSSLTPLRLHFNGTMFLENLHRKFVLRRTDDEIF